MNESMSILLGPWELNQFSSIFSEVITTRRREHPGTASGWVLQEGSIGLTNGDILTEILAVCYRSKPGSNELRPARGPVKYLAILGHLSMKTSPDNPDFPPSSSWLVDGHFIKWTPGSQSSKTLSLKIIWKLKDGTDAAFRNYNIYVKKLAKKVEEVQEYLGTAFVEAFYVSNLPVPSKTSSLRFIVQACSADGSSQKLVDCPTFSIDAGDP